MESEFITDSNLRSLIN